MWLQPPAWQQAQQAATLRRARVGGGACLSLTAWRPTATACCPSATVRAPPRLGIGGQPVQILSCRLAHAWPLSCTRPSIHRRCPPAPVCCAGALEGHLLLRSLPMLPSLPRPGDVAATELVAPPMFPLRAVATVKQPAAAAAPASLAGTPAAASKPAAAGSQQAAVAEGGEAGATETRGGGFWQRLLARAAQQQKEEPVELLIRVDGRGLGSVTRAWVEGLPPGPTPAAPGAAPGGGAAQAGSGGSGAPAQPAAAAVAEVSIVQQPAPVLPALSGGERPPLPVVGHLSAFVSW